MAYATPSLNGNKDVWDFETTVEEITSGGSDRKIRLTVSVRTRDFTGGRDGSYSVKCANISYEKTNSGSIPGSEQDRLCLFDEEINVYVAPGTTTASIDFSAVVSFYSLAAGGNITATIKITTISGFSLVSDVTTLSAKDIYFGDKCSVTWTPMSSSFSYELEFSFGNYKETSGMIYPATTKAYTYSGLTIPESASSATIYSAHEYVAVKLTQYSGQTIVGSPATTTFTITLKESVVPAITSCSAIIDNSAVPAIASWGIAIAGYSKVKINAVAEGIYNSKIDRFFIDGDYKSTVYVSSPEDSSVVYTGGVIRKSGNKSFIISCADSRGRISSKKTTSPILFYPYEPPKVTKLTIKKEEIVVDGVRKVRMIATPVWTFDSIDGHNSSRGNMYYKLSTANDWIMHSGTINQSGDQFVLTDIGELSDDSSYNFKVVVTDDLGNASDKEAFSSTTKVLMDFQAGGMGLGIGKVCEIDNIANDTQSMEVSMDAYFFREIYIKSNQQTLEDYIKSITKHLQEGIDYGDEHPGTLFDNPYPGQIYYMRVAEE